MSGIYLAWNDRYSVGDSRLDAQHQEMFNYINALYHLSNAHEQQVEIYKVLNDLFRYGQDHFSTEEGLLVSYGFPDFSTHKEEHEMYLRHVEGFRLRAIKGEPHLEYDILSFVKEWLKRHLLEVDQEYVSFLKEAALNAFQTGQFKQGAESYNKSGSSKKKTAVRSSKRANSKFTDERRGRNEFHRSKTKQDSFGRRQRVYGSDYCRGQRKGRKRQNQYKQFRTPKRGQDLTDKYAKILDLDRISLDRENVKRAYHRKVKQHHPDVLEGASPEALAEAERMMAAVNEAYDYLHSKYGIC